MMNIDYRTADALLYVVRDVETREVVGTWPATGKNAPVNPVRTISDALSADPYLRTRRLQCRKETHTVCLDTGALLTA